ncbi:MAG TPA: hypothetical protein VK419_12210 [Bryobacteraceae bacterium]|nr:hypothetical protein [Bryobacteraceae bacterium]
MLRLGCLVLLCGAAAFAADDVASAVVATVKKVDAGGKVVVVKTADGTEQTFKVVGHTAVHGAKDVGTGSVDAFHGLKEGDDVVVHYTVTGAAKTADEFDRVGKDGLKAMEGTVKGIDHGAKTMTVKTADGAETTFHFTKTMAKETGKGAEKTGKVTVYYSDEAGKKIVHYFKEG